MPNPTKVYKNGIVVDSVYPADLDHWIADGWTLQPVLEVASTPEVTAQNVEGMTEATPKRKAKPAT